MTEFNLRFIAEAANTLRFGSTIFYQTISSLQGWNKLSTDSLQCKECALFYFWGAWRNCVDDLVCEDGMSIKFHCSRNSFIRSKNSAQLYNENHKPYARRHITISSPFLQFDLEYAEEICNLKLILINYRKLFNRIDFFSFSAI